MTQRKSPAQTSSAEKNESEASSTRESTVPLQPAKKSRKNAGDKLKEIRVDKGIDLSKISSVLHISQRYLTAIESMDASNLPEQVYTLGFIRSYAHYLGVDTQPFVDQFRREMYDNNSNEKILEMPEPVKQTELPSKKAIVISLTLAVVLFIGAKLYFPQNSSISSAELTTVESANQINLEGENKGAPIEGLHTVTHISGDQKKDQQQINPPDIGSSPRTGPSFDSSRQYSESVFNQPASKVVAVSDDKFKLSFDQRTWLEMRDKNNRIIVSKNFEAGESYELFPQEGIKFETGNAGGFTIHYQGSTYKVGTLGQVVKDKALDPSDLIKIDE